MKSLFYYLEIIRRYWEGILGLFSSFALMVTVFQLFVAGKVPEIFTLSSLQIEFCIQTTLAVLIWVYWIYSTKRFFLNFNENLVLVIHITTDEDEINHKIKKVVKSTLKEIEENESLSGFKIHLLPLNYLKSDKKMRRFLDNRQSSVQTLINLKLESGSFNDIEKMKISELNFVGLFNQELPEKKVFFDTISLRKDVRLVNLDKNWDYIYTNDGNDKLKLKANLNEMILHYSGIYAIYLNKPHLALNLLLSIYQPKNSQYENIEKKDGKLKLNSDNIVASRLANILLNLYLSIAYEYFNKNEREDALNTLLACERLIKRNIHSYNVYLLTARMYFETGNLQGAKDYTLKAKSMKKNSFDIPMNLGWFASIENNPHEVYVNFNKLYNKGNNQKQNFVEIVEFVGRHKPNYPKSEPLISFIEGFYYTRYIEEGRGKRILVSALQSMPDDESYEKLKGLTRKILNKKPVQKQNPINSSKKKKSFRVRG